MLKFTLIIWMFTNSAYSMPVVVGNYVNKASCEAALAQWKKAKQHNEGVCVDAY